jgi:hypothetical protein
MAKSRILIVDGDEKITWFTRQKLEDLGYEIFAVVASFRHMTSYLQNGRHGCE